MIYECVYGEDIETSLCENKNKTIREWYVTHLFPTNDEIYVFFNNFVKYKKSSNQKEYFNDNTIFNEYSLKFIDSLVNLLNDNSVFSKEIKKLPSPFLNMPKLSQLKMIENILHNLKEYSQLYEFADFINSLKIINKRKLHEEIVNYFKNNI